jgi:hypothetical protein
VKVLPVPPAMLAKLRLQEAVQALSVMHALLAPTHLQDLHAYLVLQENSATVLEVLVKVKAVPHLALSESTEMLLELQLKLQRVLHLVPSESMALLLEEQVRVPLVLLALLDRIKSQLASHHVLSVLQASTVSLLDLRVNRTV